MYNLVYRILIRCQNCVPPFPSIGLIRRNDGPFMITTSDFLSQLTDTQMKFSWKEIRPEIKEVATSINRLLITS